MSDKAPSRLSARDADALHRAQHLQEAGDPAGAAALYRELAAAHPRQAALWALLGDAQRMAGDAEGGADALSKAAALAPDDADIAVEWALALNQTGRPQAAPDALRGHALDGSPRGLAVRAEALHQTGKAAEGAEAWRRLLALEPGNLSAQIGLGVCLQEAGDIAAAIGCYEAALAQAPGSAEALTNLGLALSEQDDLDAALVPLQRAASLEPDDAETLCALGAVLQKQGDAAAAAVQFEHATAVAPEDARAWSNLGNAYEDLLRLESARAAHDRAVALAPQDAGPHWNRAMTLLLSGDFNAGFQEYEWRYRTASHAPPTHASPLWDGRDPAGLRLLLLAEQGFGDAIQFVRYAPLLNARGADIAIQCHPKLTALFATLAGAPTVLSTGTPPPDADAHLPLMSLPHRLGTTAETVPADIPYLHPPQDAAPPPDSDGQPRVGLCWTGNPDHPDNAHRSIPFTALEKLLRRRDIDWRGLQFGPAAAEAAGRLPDDPACTACLDGFGNTAAALKSCDLVITIDTATAHLAGALGRPIWLLLKYAPDWRWMLGRDDSPWYPTMRLFRQAAPGDWAGTVAFLETALDAWMTC